MKNIAIFASGSGSNAENFVNYFSGNKEIRVAMFFCNNPKAGVIERAKKLGVPCMVFDKRQLYETGEVADALRRNSIDYLVLAGFLLLIPDDIRAVYGRRIVNIHPSLLPKYGGKGMYGDRVHEAVIAAGDKVSGITIHRVNEFYDDGSIVCQKTCDVAPDDTPHSLATKVHALEYQWFPVIVEQDILSEMK